MSEAHIYPTGNLAARVKSARKARGMTQKDLAAQLGIDQAHVSRIENGSKVASVELLARIAKLLGVPLSELIDDTVTEPEDTYETGGIVSALHSDYNLPDGLRDLLNDKAMTEAMNITDDEWRALASMRTPGVVSKDGYIQLLITLRAISQ